MTTRPTSRRRLLPVWPWTLVVLAAALALSASLWPAGASALAHADAEARPAGELRGGVIVPVWALLDGDTPLSGARVRVYAGGLRAVGRRRPLRQLRGARTERTHKSGVALLEFARLPRNFTVVISGGRSEGRRLRGFLSARVRAYREGRVVHVNPVTTLVELWRRINPRVSHRRATRAVERALGIPSWVDNVDLRASDRWLDGERFLRHVRVHATLDRATGDLLFDIRRGRRTTRFRARRGRAGAPVAQGAAGPSGLVATVFTRLATGALEGVGNKAGGEALGWLLSAFGLSDSNAQLRQEIANIRKVLDELGKQITQVQNRLELAGFSTLVHQTDRTIGEIDHAMSQLALLANLPADDPTKREFTRTVVDYIGSHLLDAPAILNQNLSSNVPLSDNLIKSASRLLNVRERFFDKDTSDKVTSVYDYFAGYQAKLAILLVEYYHAKPDTYSATTIKANLDQIDGNVSAQASSLKPRVPDGTVVDTKTGLMWMQTIDGSSLRTLPDVLACCRQGSQPLELTRFSTSTTLPGLPFNNWAMPDAQNLQTLLSDRGNDSPLDFLATKAGITRRILDAANSHVWIRDTFACVNLYYGSVATYRLFDLKDAALAGETRTQNTCRTNVWPDPAWQRDSGVQAILFRRVRAAGEDYWWG